MSWGLQIFDAAGNEMLGPLDSMTLLLGSTTLPTEPGQSGSITVPGFVSGRPFHLISHGSASINNDIPVITISGTTLSWNTGDFGSVGTPILYYGTWGIHSADYVPPAGYGMQIFNEAGYLQFDTNSVPFVQRDKQTMVYADGQTLTGPYATRIYTLTTSVPNPIPAFAGSAAALNSISDNGDGTWRVTFLGPDGQTDAAFTIYIFGTNVGAPPASGYGLEIYNAAGQVVFNHTMKPLKIYSAHTLNALSGTLIAPGDMPAGRSLAVIQCRPATRMQYFDDPGSERGEVRKYISASQVLSGISTTTIYRSIIFPDVDEDRIDDSPGYALVIDVTHY